MEFLIFSFQNIPYLFSNCSSSKTFEVHKSESMENTLKTKVFIKLILFCQYQPNRCLDLHEILCGGQVLSCKLKFHEDRGINVRARVINACAYLLSQAISISVSLKSISESFGPPYNTLKNSLGFSQPTQVLAEQILMCTGQIVPWL